VPSVVAFDADKYSGKAPLTVNFIDQSSNNPTTWAWDFDGNGTTDSTQQNPSHQYTQPGTYNVTLTVTNAAGPASLTKPGFINVGVPDCLVPSMTGKKRNVSLGLWTTAGFTQANFHNAPGAPNGNFTVTFQSITAGSSVPCTSVIEVNG
jgi:PKD repeat protein